MSSRSEAEGEAGGDAEVVLQIVLRVGQVGVDPVRFHDGPAEMGVEGGADAAADAERLAALTLYRRVARHLQRSAAQHLRVRQEAPGEGAEGVARTEEIVEDSDRLGGGPDGVGMGGGEVGDDAESARHVEGQRPISSVGREAAALAWRRVGVEKGVAEAGLESRRLTGIDAKGFGRALLGKESGRECDESDEQDGLVKSHLSSPTARSG